MKLDYYCARNIMLTIEALDDNDALTEENCTNAPLLKAYPANQIHYTVERLIEASFIPNYCFVRLINGATYKIDSLTWEGHQYLDCIRNDAPWEKSILQSKFFESVPFKILCELALQNIRLGLGLPT